MALKLILNSAGSDEKEVAFPPNVTKQGAECACMASNFFVSSIIKLIIKVK